jgi:acyl-CoA dehydrogenase
MDFELNEAQRMLRASAGSVAKDFPPEYWREKEEKVEHADEFWDACASAGFNGIIIPQDYGGSGLGMTELLLVMEALAQTSCGMAGVWYLVINEVFGGMSVLKHGTEEQKKRYLPGIASGEEHWCMCLTEPDAGSNTLNTKTTARREDNGWVINGDKTFISEADIADHTMIIVRTTPMEKAEKRTQGVSLILGDLPDPHVDIAPIAKHAINYSHSCTVGFNDYRVPLENMMVEDNGWYALLDTLNTERMSFTAAAIGIGRLAIRHAVEYSKTRRVFGDTPIGAYQALSFPLALSYAQLECAELLMYKAAKIYDDGGDYRAVGPAANMAKAAAVEAGTQATYWAMQTFGGYGYAKEYDVERWWREMQLIRLAPITQQMALNYITQYVIGMPRGYS